MLRAVLHQSLGPLICYKGCRHTEDTQFITAFHNTPPSDISKDEKGGRGCRPSSKAPTNCQQELLLARRHCDRRDTPAQQPAAPPPPPPGGISYRPPQVQPPQNANWNSPGLALKLSRETLLPNGQDKALMNCQQELP